MRSYTFKVAIEEEPFEDGRMAYHAYVPVLDDHACYTWGYTKEEALRNIQEVTRIVLESMLAHGEPIPKDQVSVSDEPLITVTI